MFWLGNKGDGLQFFRCLRAKWLCFFNEGERSRSLYRLFFCLRIDALTLWDFSTRSIMFIVAFGRTIIIYVAE